MKRISILGSTGSIGTQTLQVVDEQADLEVVALSAGRNVELLAKQIQKYQPKLVSVAQKEDVDRLAQHISLTNCRIVYGMEGLIEVATFFESDIIVTAIVGMMGIRPTIEAIKVGKQIALANKETLVTAGHIIMPLAKKYGINIYPVDSEHSAIFQCINGENNNPINRIILTASGGAFRGKTKEELQNVTPLDALKHPNWTMGQKITIDSATMVNKGLEVIEAKWLYDVEYDQIEVVIQPQSIIHSMVEFADGSIMAQLGCPDMRLPIQYALYYPTRRALQAERLDFKKLSAITFEQPNNDVFRGLPLAYMAGKQGGNMPTVYNAANEECVALFLKEKISFLDISNIIEQCLLRICFIKNPSVEEILYTQEETIRYIYSELIRQ